MAKRRKKRKPARSVAANPRKRRKKKARHGVARSRKANPAKRRKLRHRAGARTRKANPRKRRKARHTVATRARRANPRRAHKRRSGKRRHKRNPGIPMWAMAGLGAVVGLAAFTVVSAGSFAVTQRLDPSLGSLIRNRRIAAGLATVGGVALAFVSPVIGAGLAAGGLAVLAGTEASLALGGLIDKPAPASPPSKAADSTISGVFNAGSQRFNGVFNAGSQRFGALVDGGRQRFAGLHTGEASSIFDGEQAFGG